MAESADKPSVLILGGKDVLSMHVYNCQSCRITAESRDCSG